MERRSPVTVADVTDPADVAHLAARLGDRLGVPVTVDAVERPKAGGLSSETWIVTATWAGAAHDLVVRRPPTGRGLFPTYDLGAQVRVMEALRSTGAVPVPTVLWHEHDPAGRDLVVMERISGRIPSDNPGYHFEGWLRDLPAAEQATLLDAALEVLAAIHRVDWAAAGLGFLPGLDLAAEITRWRAYLEWVADGERFAVIDDALAWCEAHRPTDEPAPSLVWGDARLGNLIFSERVDDLPLVRAVLDWEMASIGPAELDLGWYLFLERTALQFAAQLAGFPDQAGTVAAYERHLGREVRDLHWYEVWGGVRSAAVMVRVADDLAELGLVGRDFRGDNPTTRMLASLIG